MVGYERLVLAALLHDLPGLLGRASEGPSSGVEEVLRLAALEDPALMNLRTQAEAYAAPGGRHELPVSRGPLLSVFSRVRLRNPEEPARRVHGLQGLRATGEGQEELFPAADGDIDELDGYLAKLAGALGSLVPLVRQAEFARLYSHLLSILHRYGNCLAAHAADVALFDHLRLTSAVAACLYRYRGGDLDGERISASSDVKRFALVVGDVSGIQDYIFGITNIGAGGVARRLRARSLQLSVISESISHLVAHQFQVPLGNVIMASGGRFYVLVPHLEDLADRMDTLRSRIDNWLRDRSNGELAVNLAWTTFSGGNLAASAGGEAVGFSEVVTGVNRKLAVGKRRRGAVLLQDGSQWREDMFTVKRDYWGRQVCPSCQRFPAEPDSVCRHCQRDADLGRRLPEARYVVYFRESTSHHSLPGGYSFALLEDDELSKLKGEPYLVVQLNNPDLLHLSEYPASFRYLATYVPVFGSAGDVEAFAGEVLGRPPTTADLERWGINSELQACHYPRVCTFAALAYCAQGRPLLGYIKADVDHLGLCFAQGLRRESGPSYDTAARQAMLSRQLDWFFSGYVQHLLSQDDRYGNFYTIFSGGDDLFLVGPWDEAAGLAREIYQRFRAFVGQNPELTLSAGILFTKDRYPISRAAEEAEEVLEQSKERVWDDGAGNRDQLTVLDDTFRWERMDEIFDEIERLRGWSSRQMPSSFLHNLVEYARLYRLWVEEEKIEGLRYKAVFAYDIARNLQRGDPDLYRWADALLQSLHSSKPSLAMQHLGLIATYTLFGRRGRA